MVCFTQSSINPSQTNTTTNMHRIITSKTPSLSFPSLILRSFSANATEGGITSAAAVKKLREASGSSHGLQTSSLATIGARRSSESHRLASCQRHSEGDEGQSRDEGRVDWHLPRLASDHPRRGELRDRLRGDESRFPALCCFSGWVSASPRQRDRYHYLVQWWGGVEADTCQHSLFLTVRLLHSSEGTC